VSAGAEIRAAGPEAGRTAAAGPSCGVRIEIGGRVQGVGFRPWVHSVATAAGIAGRVFNAGSRVVVEAFGSAEALDHFARVLASPPMPAAAVDEVRVTAIATGGAALFEIGDSAAGEGARTPSIPPDLALCEECRRELLDPGDRRYRYAFVNCTRCGPRYTISRDVPYDRARTTMAAFPMCPACAAEYSDPRDRRFHAEPVGCPECGPRLHLIAAPGGRPAGTARDARATASGDEERITSGDPAAPATGPAAAGDEQCTAHDEPHERAQRVPGREASAPALARADRTVVDLAPAAVELSRSKAARARSSSMGPSMPADPVAGAGAALRAGAIVAVKGLGGFHLACDATSAAAVGALRARKRRDARPLAVMVEDLSAAERLAVVSPAEARLLESAERPIALLVRRPDSGLAEGVAPGLPTVGVMLAYTPLHLLLLREVGRPLVMTSGNVSDEPMAHQDDDAHARLGALADVFLEHDRAIENRCDDSVAAVVAGRPTVLRRARGYVPRPVRLSRALAQPVLACGAHLKNAACLAGGREAWLGPHVGDLETLEACRDFARAVERLERLVGIAPEVIAHDLHPDYHSTRYALGRPETVKIGVQHHHAHVAAAMAEHGIEDRVIGLAWDGTGYGADGAAWGGELLVADFTGFERIATFRPLPLAGGDAAIREVWRLALAALDDAFDGAAPLAAFPVFADIAPFSITAVRRIIAGRRHAPAAHGVGRWFDALGAAFLGCPRARYEGEAAVLWNHAADPAERRRYPFTIDDGDVSRVDLRPLVRAAARDFLDGASAGTISARFHNTLGAAAAEMVARATERAGRLPVALTGGCFQNARLVDEVLRALAGRTVIRHGEIPPGDGGIALGQALVADAIARRTA